MKKKVNEQERRKKYLWEGKGKERIEKVRECTGKRKEQRKEMEDKSKGINREINGKNEEE